MSRSKELQGIINAIHKYVEKHNGDVEFHASFCAFDEKGDVIDDQILCFGYKDTVLIDLEDFTEQVKKEGDEFINF